MAFEKFSAVGATPCRPAQTWPCMLRCRGRGLAMPPPHLDVGESKKTLCRHNDLMSYTVLFNIEQESYPYAYPVVYLR